MAKAKRGLGIGKAVAEVKETVDKKVSYIDDYMGMKVVLLNVNTLVEYQDNERVFGNLEGKEFDDLVNSIKERGVLQPIIVRPQSDQYEILAGHQRTRGTKANGNNKIPAIIKDVDDIEARKIWLETNIRGRHLSKEKLGEALLEYAKLVDKDRKEGNVKGKTSAILAEKFDMKPRTVEELLMFTKKLTSSIRELNLAKTSMTELTKLSKEEQESLLLLLGEDTVKELATKEIKEKIEIIKNNMDQEYKTKLKEANEKVRKTEKDLEKKSKTYQDLRENLGKISIEKADIERKIEEEIRQRKELESKLEEANAEDKEKLKKDIKAKDGEIDELLKGSLQLEEEKNKLDKKIKEVEEEKKELSDNFMKLNDEYKKTILENNDLKNKLKNHDTLMQELKELKEKDRLDEDLREINSHLSNALILLNNLDGVKDKKHLDRLAKMEKVVEQIQKFIKL